MDASIADRIVISPTGCWEWQGRLDRGGYGRICRGAGKWVIAHRYVYQQFKGATDLPLDHLCRNRRCVNPDHLEPVTTAENNRRGFGFSGINDRATHCAYGHPFDEQNTGHVAGKKKRVCKQCDARRHREAKARKLEKAA